MCGEPLLADGAELLGGQPRMVMRASARHANHDDHHGHTARQQADHQENIHHRGLVRRYVRAGRKASAFVRFRLPFSPCVRAPRQLFGFVPKGRGLEARASLSTGVVLANKSHRFKYFPRSPFSKAWYRPVAAGGNRCVGGKRSVREFHHQRAVCASSLAVLAGERREYR